MNSPVSIEELASAVRRIHRSDAPRTEMVIEQYLEDRLKDFRPSEKLELLGRLTNEFKTSAAEPRPAIAPDPEQLSRLFSLFLGEKVSEVEMNSPDFPSRLASSLNTVFDTVNEIISVMNATLQGEKHEMEETTYKTIRYIIGTDLQDESGGDSLEAYLDQIKRAFLMSHQAFKQAAWTIISKILIELDPEKIAGLETGSLKFGPLKKARSFDMYQERFRKVRNWFESPRFTENLLREFERTCQNLYR